MELYYFGKRQESHLAKAPVKFLVLVQDVICRRLKIGFRSRQKVRNRSCHKFLRPQLEPAGNLIELFSLAIVDFNQNLHFSLDYSIIACRPPNEALRPGDFHEIQARFGEKEEEPNRLDDNACRRLAEG